MTEMKLAAIVVWFKPDVQSVLANILSYINDVDKLLIYQNSDIGPDEIQILDAYQHKIELLGDGWNVGIAAALNAGANWAMIHNYSHLLTLDQDSYFPDGHLRRFKSLIIGMNLPNAGIFCANPENRGKLTFISQEPYLDVPDSITSGSIFPTKVFESCGLFEADLFIDAVDYEYCYRLRSRYGLATIVFPDIVLKHEVGYPTKINLGLTTDNYTAFRTYFIIRNHITIWKRYPKLFQPAYKKTLIKIHITYRLAKIVIGEADKISKIRAIVVGMFHGFSGRTGYYKI